MHGLGAMQNSNENMRNTSFLTKYECSRVLGLRYLQLQHEETTTIVHGSLRSFVIRELLDGKNLFVVRREMPDGTSYDKKVSELIVPDDIRQQLEYILTFQQTAIA